MINIKKSKATRALLRIQKKNFFTNLLQEMRQEGLIHRVSGPKQELVQNIGDV